MTSRRARDTVLDYLPRFASYMQTSTKLSPRTRQLYAYHVKKFGETVGNRSVGNLTAGEMLSWHAAFYDTGAAPATVGQKFAAVRRFLSYLEEFEDVESAAKLLRSMKRLQMPKRATPAREPYALTREQVEKMLVTAERQHPAVGLRDRTMLHFMWATGVRRAELVDLEMDWLDLEERVASVVGKGSKERAVVFDQATAVQLQRWLDDRETWPVHCNRVFLSAGGHPIPPQQVSALVRETAKAAGLRKDVWAHLFRHTRLTELLDGGMPLQDGAVFAGHASADTTLRYFHATPKGLRASYDRARVGRRRGPALVEPPEQEEETE